MQVTGGLPAGSHRVTLCPQALFSWSGDAEGRKEALAASTHGEKFRPSVCIYFLLE
jgi:hypothetical protein